MGFCPRKAPKGPVTTGLACIYRCMRGRMLGRFSRVRLFVTPWTVACQAPLSMEFSRQEYWSGLPFPSPGDLSDLKPVSRITSRFLIV